MYKYPPVKKCFAGQEVFEFQWAAIKKDNTVGGMLKDRTKLSICDKAKVMCKERRWESLTYFYKEQQNLRQDMNRMEIEHKKKISSLAQKLSGKKRVRPAKTQNIDLPI